MKYDEESIIKRKENIKIIKIILGIIAIILIYNIILIIITSVSEDEFNLFGYKSYIIKTNSMEPTIKIGDIVITKKVRQEKINSDDVITFSHNEEVITHRIVKIEKQEDKILYITKGDNNNVEDTFKITYDNIEGKEILTIPYLGKILQALNDKIILLIIVLIILIYAFAKIQKKEKLENRREKKKIEDKQKAKI